jgi:hypothetical protein
VAGVGVLGSGVSATVLAARLHDARVVLVTWYVAGAGAFTVAIGLGLVLYGRTLTIDSPAPSRPARIPSRSMRISMNR